MFLPTTLRLKKNTYCIAIWFWCGYEINSDNLNETLALGGRERKDNKEKNELKHEMNVFIYLKGNDQ